MITFDNIMETNRMITENKLYVRTITMGISLRDCAHPNINQFCKINDVFKMKIMSISEDGKISLSIKKAEEQPATREKADKKPRAKRERPKPVVDSSYVWTPQKSESESFEEMMNRFKATSDDKFSDLKRKNVETKRPRRGGSK